ncbi:thiamine-phosphate kinase, partial [bacterium]|nr:thiamine-phosphate kinase [bacterium]
DTTSSEKDLVISITILGDAAKNEIVYRSGAKEDDLICVTNMLGSSSLGLELLRRGIKEGVGYIENHINPKPPLNVGPLLAKSGIATSMIDISDGLLGDLRHICDRSGVGARIYWDKIPLKDGFVDICDSYHLNPMDLALAGGEDYELLFTVSKEKEGDLNKLIESNQLCATIIGLIVDEDNSIRVFEKDNREIVIAQMGYEHLK